MKKLTILLFILIFFSAPLKANLDSLLLGLDEINGLKQVEPPRIYNNMDLFVMIDGGAETYLEYGFNRALDASYLLGDTKRIRIQLYEMTDDGAAFGIFSSSRNEGDSTFPIGDFASGNEYYIMIQKSRFYFIVSGDDNLPEIKQAMNSVAKRIAENISEKAILPELVKLPLSAGYKIEQIKYIRGKIALSGNYFFTHKEIFKTRDAVCIEDGERKLFIFQYSNEPDATANLKFINEELVSSGRYTQFAVEDGKICCLDRNLRQLSFQVSNKYIIATFGQSIEEEKLKKLLTLF
jgi:hypothetical protein